MWLHSVIPGACSGTCQYQRHGKLELQLPSLAFLCDLLQGVARWKFETLGESGLVLYNSAIHQSLLYTLYTFPVSSDTELCQKDTGHKHKQRNVVSCY